MCPLQVLVLPGMTRQVPVYLRPAVAALDSQTASSNVYSRPERVVLAWLNHHYKQQRASVLASSGKPVPQPYYFEHVYIHVLHYSIFILCASSTCTLYFVYNIIYMYIYIHIVSQLYVHALL